MNVVSAYVLCCACAQIFFVVLATTHDAAGSGQISSAKMKEHREMSRLVSRSQAKRSIVKLVAAM